MLYLKTLKKTLAVIALFSLAILLCSCSFINASPEKAVEAIVEGTLEYNAELIYKAQFEFNRDIRERFDSDFDEDEFSDEFAEMKEFFAEQKAEQEELYAEVSYTYEIIRTNIYSRGDTEFELFAATVESTEYADCLDLIDSIAEVRISGEMSLTDKDGYTDTEDISNTFNCVCVDGKWYVTG